MSDSIFKFRPIFVTGTGTDVGKTYVTALLCKALKTHLQVNYQDKKTDNERLVSYYKAAISGAESIDSSDAGYINTKASLNQQISTLTSYLYQEAVSPHLAQQHEGSEPISLEVIKQAFLHVASQSMLTVLEGSGGIYCPLCWDHSQNDKLYISEDNPSALMSKIELNCFTIVDFMKELSQSYGLSVVVVADAALGCINNVVMTLTSLKAEGFKVEDIGVIVNNYDKHNAMHEDNVRMIEAMTKIPVIATIKKGAHSIDLDTQDLNKILRQLLHPKMSVAHFQDGA